MTTRKFSPVYSVNSGILGDMNWAKSRGWPENRIQNNSPHARTSLRPNRVDPHVIVIKKRIAGYKKPQTKREEETTVGETNTQV